MSFSARTLHLSEEQHNLLRPAMLDTQAVERLLGTLAAWPPRLEAEVLATKRVGAGAGVSYGHTFRTSTATTLALVAIGYGHGLPRKAGNRASVSWEGNRMPIVGRVAMDVLVIDAGDVPVASGGSVVFFGEPAAGEIPLSTWAEAVGEHPFSILACFDDRVTRVVAS